MLDALDNAEMHLQYWTNTPLALDEARKTIEEGGRLGVSKIIVLVTDGYSYNGNTKEYLQDETVAAAAKIHDADIKMFALGLYGDKIEADEHRDAELNAIASDPDTKYLKKLRFADMAAQLESIANEAC